MNFNAPNNRANIYIQLVAGIAMMCLIESDDGGGVHKYLFQLSASGGEKTSRLVPRAYFFV
jgi:hypothetical protein